MSRQNVKREVEEDKAEYADLYRDIRGQFTKGKPTRIVLRHVRMVGAAQGQGDTDVATWDAEHFENLSPDEFTKELLTEALEDSSIFQGVQTYGVFIFRKNKSTHDQRLFLRIAGGDGDAEKNGLGPSEGPDEHGRMSQIMRHDEAFTRLNLGGIQQSMQMLLRRAERDEVIIEKLTESHVRTMEALDKLIDSHERRNIELERTRKNYMYMDQGIEKVLEFAPLLLAAKVKKTNPDMADAIVKATSNPAPQILQAFISEMEANPAQAGKVMEAVAALPNGTAILQALNQLAQMQKQAQAVQQAPSETTNGAATHQP